MKDLKASTFHSSNLIERLWEDNEFYLHSQIKGFSPRKANKENLTTKFPLFMKGSLVDINI